MEGADTVYPRSASVLARGRRVRSRQGPRRKTMPVTFAEIKEVDEENADLAAGGSAECEGRGEGERRRRRPDVLDARLGRRAPALHELSPPRTPTLCELSPPRAHHELSPRAAPKDVTRADSEPPLATDT